MLIGNEGMEKLSKSKVAVFGLGGVGSFVCEGLARSGIGNFVLVDFDKID
ncbi:ThiF family adenylyltransferase, partial [Methanobrevibacter sp.]